MAENRLGSHPAARLKREICRYKRVPLVSVFPNAALVIEHPVHRSVDVGLVHECSERDDDIVETKKIRAIDFGWQIAFDNSIIVGPRQQAFNAVQSFSLRESNKFSDSGSSLSLSPDARP